MNDSTAKTQDTRLYGAASHEPTPRSPRQHLLSQLHTMQEGNRAVIVSIQSVFATVTTKADVVLALYGSDPFDWVSGFLPHASANETVLAEAGRLLHEAKGTPVLAGVCALDPFFSHPQLVRRVLDAGFAGVVNFPGPALCDGMLRYNLEKAGLGFHLDVRLMHLAAQQGAFTLALVSTPEEAREVAAAGVDGCLLHLGLTPPPPQVREEKLAAMRDVSAANPEMHLFICGGSMPPDRVATLPLL